MMEITREPAQALTPGQGAAYWLLGSLVTIKVHGELTDNALSVSEHLAPVGFGLPPHIHHVEDEILCILEGEIVGSCGEQPIGGGAGSLIFLPRGVAHAWWVIGTAPARLLIVTTPAGFERFCAAAGEPAQEQALPTGPVAAAALDKLLAVAPQYGLEMLPATT